MPAHGKKIAEHSMPFVAFDRHIMKSKYLPKAQIGILSSAVHKYSLRLTRFSEIGVSACCVSKLEDKEI